jgi:hypothetical protein
MAELLTIAPTNTDLINYYVAKDLQRLAEMSTDPTLYNIAANAFAALGMLACSASCKRRAEHYLKILREETP